MLEAIRRGATKAFVTVLFTILLLSFALWGIPDFTRDRARAPIASIGSTEIPVDEFMSALNEQRMAMSRQFQTNLTPEQARAFGLDQRVLSELVSRAAVSEHAKQLGLRLSDAYIAEQVRTNPAFQGPDKKFSRSVFEAQIRQFGLTEARFFRDAREATLREQLTLSLADGIQPSPLMIEIAHKYREEQRTIAYMTLDPAKVPKPAAPDDTKLKEQYERVKSQFKSGETRKFTVLMLTRDDVKTRIKIDDAEVKAEWEKNSTAWDIPERRKYQMVVLPDKAKAAAAAKEVAGGKALFLLALETSGAAGRLDHGPSTRREIGDARLAGAIFSLPVGKLSDPIDVRGGVALVNVTEIEPGRTRTFEEVAAEVRARMEQTRLAEIEKQLHEQIEDKRGARRPFTAIAEELKLKAIEVASSDRAGNKPDGKPALDHPDARRLVASAFEGDKVAIREPVALTGGGEGWVEVLEVTPETQKPFEDVKADVLAIWTDLEHQKAIAAAADALVERIKKGETADAVAKSADLKLETSQPFTRATPTDKLPPNGNRLAFTLPKGGAASVESQDKKTRIVFTVTDIKAASLPTKEEAEKLAGQLREQLQQDTLATYMAALRDRLGFTVNQAVYERAVGIDRTQTR